MDLDFYQRALADADTYIQQKVLFFAQSLQIFDSQCHHDQR